MVSGNEDLEHKAGQILSDAIDAARADRLIAEYVRLDGNSLQICKTFFNLATIEKIWVIGAGKTSAHMAESLENILGDKISGGIVVTKYGHTRPCRRIEIREAAHPVVDENALSATADMLDLLEDSGEKDLVICLISGGGSALLEALPEEVPLPELQWLQNELLRRGADIRQMNIVRKHFSLVKGGQLALRIAPAAAVTLLISDVPGDDLSLIASGPTVPDSSTFEDVGAILEQVGLAGNLPPEIASRLRKGLAGEIDETPAALPDSIAANQSHHILASNQTALQAAARSARDLGFETYIMPKFISGEAREAGAELADFIQAQINAPGTEGAPRCFLFGGETTVTVRGNGSGGRNQELALAALGRLLPQETAFVLLCCGTDGSDGPTDAAGAQITPRILKTIRERQLDPAPFLENNDSYHFWEQAAGLLKTGPTGTNVMDIGIILLP